MIVIGNIVILGVVNRRHESIDLKSRVTKAFACE